MGYQRKGLMGDMAVMKYKWIIDEANKFFGFDVTSRSRVREIVVARRMVMSYIRDEFELTWRAIGLQFRGLDHSTVMHNYKQHWDTMRFSHLKDYSAYYRQYKELERRLNTIRELRGVNSDKQALSSALTDLKKLLSKYKEQKQSIIVYLSE